MVMEFYFYVADKPIRDSTNKLSVEKSEGLSRKAEHQTCNTIANLLKAVRDKSIQEVGTSMYFIHNDAKYVHLHGCVVKNSNVCVLASG